VLSYSRNGKATPLNSILPSGSALATVATALKPYLVKQGSNQTLGPEIVIDQGFGAFTASNLTEGYYFRHQHFPANNWQSLGPLSAADGSFYDPNGQLVWQPDPTNPGTYIGYAPAAEFDFSRYNQAPAPIFAATSPNNTLPAPKSPQNPVFTANTPANSPTLVADTSALTPQLIAIIDPITKVGQAIIPNPPASAPGHVPVLWSAIPDPVTGKMDFSRIGTPDYAQHGPSDVPKSQPATFALDAQATRLLNDGPVFMTSEPSDVPATKPTGDQTVIVPLNP
jgi:hypothetical protein